MGCLKIQKIRLYNNTYVFFIAKELDFIGFLTKMHIIEQKKVPHCARL